MTLNRTVNVLLKCLTQTYSLWTTTSIFRYEASRDRFHYLCAQETNYFVFNYFSGAYTSSPIPTPQINKNKTRFFEPRYRGRLYLEPSELNLSPLSKCGYAVFFQVKTTTLFIRLTPFYRMCLLFCKVKQLY